MRKSLKSFDTREEIVRPVVKMLRLVNIGANFNSIMRPYMHPSIRFTSWKKRISSCNTRATGLNTIETLLEQ